MMKASASKEKINSFCIAVFLCANPLTWFFPFIPNILAIIALFVTVIFILNNKGIAPKALIMSLCIIGIFMVSIIFDNDNKYLYEYFGFFIVLGVPGLLLSNSHFSIHIVYKNIFIISIFLIPLIYNMDFGNPDYESVDYGHWMGISYGVLRLINVILIILFFSNKSYKIKLLICIPLLFYIIICMNYASRGAVIAIFLLLFLIFDIKYGLKSKTLLILIGLGLFIFLFLFNVEDILLYVNDNLSQLGIHVLFLEKTLRMFMEHALSNGRDVLAYQAINGIMKSPFAGNGIASFESQYGRYPHSVILQIFYEGGVLLFIPFFLIFLYSIYYILNNKKEIEKRLFFSYLFTSGVVELLFSSVYWKSQIFWFYIGYSVYTFLYELKKNKNENTLRRI